LVFGMLLFGTAMYVARCSHAPRQPQASKGVVVAHEKLGTFVRKKLAKVGAGACVYMTFGMKSQLRLWLILSVTRTYYLTHLTSSWPQARVPSV